MHTLSRGCKKAFDSLLALQDLKIKKLPILAPTYLARGTRAGQICFYNTRHEAKAK